MPTVQAPGLPADWLNAWLAAIGTTVLVPNLRLSWEQQTPPTAELTHDTDNVLDAIADKFPSSHDLDQLAIARKYPNSGHELPRHVSIDAYRDRCHLARGTHDLSVACTISDLRRDLKNDQVDHGPFDPPVPKGLTLHERLMSSRADLPEDKQQLRERIGASFAGTAVRTNGNGLGYDYRRLAAGVQARANNSVDTCIEVLAFFGSWLFPVRGNGYHTMQRGWRGPPSARGAFTWPTWSHRMDRWGIDALLDIWHTHPPRLELWGMTQGFQSVSYQITSKSDRTRGYASEPLS